MDSTAKKFAEYITTSIYFDKTTLKSEGLSSDIWDKYLPLGTCKKKKAGDFLIRTGDNPKGLYFVKRGKVKSNILGKDGMLKTIQIVSEGCTFGDQFVFHEQPGLFEALIIEDTELCFFSKETILDIMKKDFEFNLFIIKSLSIKSRMLACQLEDTCLRNILQSVCRILHSLCCYEVKGKQDQGEVVIDLSHQELANMLSSHRVTITKTLSKLKIQGVLDYKYEKIVIKDRQKLKSIAFENNH